MRTINKNCVLVQFVTKKDEDRFLNVIKEKTNTLQVCSPRKRNPNVLLKNLPNEISDHEVLWLLKEQNLELEEEKQLWEETKICFTLKKFKNSWHLVLEMNPTYQKLCLNMNFLRVNWNICKIEDFIAINRCFKCLGYNHKAADCWHLPAYDSFSDHKAIKFVLFQMCWRTQK
ncbi:uncharacterized protein TNIN_314531 [Trichonephila inaurata madagascariensis]|uniref:Uncharacterized protein n=1 Tax=Trichonephila inaurata madagascariensis TaxID=2747483 RepID=A0A8X6XUR0_9ARAC|nr:uncharacterized protein TNIN_314531 [Trichonephila inaurata madagascariensis]